MTRILPLLLAAAFTFPLVAAEQAVETAGTAAQAVAAKPTWLTDLAAAKAESKATGKPILMDFTGSDWCGWCIKLDQEVFSTVEFETWAAANVVLLKVDFPRKIRQEPGLKEQNQKLAKTYSIEGYPTIVLVSGKGKTLGSLGYMKGGPKPWIAEAESIIK